MLQLGRWVRPSSILFLLAAGAPAAHAHSLQDPAIGLAAGFRHPLLGLDHLLAMLAVGLWAARSDDKRARWLVPASFVAMMALGGWAGLAGIRLPFGELGIAGSLLLLGLLLAFAVRLPLVTASALVGLFAVAHGHAHGTEMPALASPMLYGAGFVATTALLLAAGIGLGRLAGSATRQRVLRTASAAIAAYGLLLLGVAV